MERPYLVVVALRDPRGQEHHRVLQAFAADECAAAASVVEPLHLTEDWSVRDVTVYELADSSPVRLVVSPAPEWVIRG